MTTNRREFLKIAGASALTLMAPAILRPAWAKENVIIPGSITGPHTLQMLSRPNAGLWRWIRQNAAPAVPIALPPVMRCTTFPISATPRMKSNGSGRSLLPPPFPVKIMRIRKVHQKVAAACFVQSLRESALCPRLPHEGHVPAAGRHRHDGLSPLHRLPALHGRLPLRRKEHELPGPPAVYRKNKSGLSDAHQRSRGEMQLL